MVMAALAFAALAAAPGPFSFANQHYAAVFDPAEGGLITELRAKPSGEVFVQGMNIYTDYGLYPKRGYVGTRGAQARQFKVQKMRGAAVVVAEGSLKGREFRAAPPIAYRVEFRMDQSPDIAVKASITPGMSAEAVQGFLGLSWAVPALRSFSVRTVLGLLRHVCQPDEGKLGRAYMGRTIPLDTDRPMIELRGAANRLVIDQIKWSGKPAFTGPVIHGRAFFLCWLDGLGRDVVAGATATLEFRMRVLATAGGGSAK